MQYDPIKKKLGNIFNRTPWMRKLFYKMLDLLLLRAWHVRKAIKEWGKTAPKNAKILDAGSGFGQYDYFISSLNSNWEIKAVDVKEEQIADCNRFFAREKKENVHFEYANLLEYSSPDTYDLIISIDVMEHILEDVKVFQNFYVSMKPGGMLLVSTPSDQGGSDVHDHHDESFIDEHVRDGYSLNEIQDKLKIAGFKKTEVHYQYGKPGKLSWRLSMKYPILALGKTKLFYLILPFYYLLTFPLCLYLNGRDVNKKQSTGTGLIVKAWK